MNSPSRETLSPENREIKQGEPLGCLRGCIEVPRILLQVVFREIPRRAFRTTRRIMATTAFVGIVITLIIGFEKLGRYQDLGFARAAWKDSLNNDGDDVWDMRRLRSIMMSKYYFHSPLALEEIGITEDQLNQREQEVFEYDQHLRHVKQIDQIIHMLADDEEQLEENLHVLPVSEYLRQLDISLKALGFPPGMIDAATIRRSTEYQNSRLENAGKHEMSKIP